MLLKKPMSQQRHWKEKKLHWDNWKQKHNFWKCMRPSKAVLRQKFIVRQTYIKKPEKSQVNNLTLHLKELGKPQVSRGRK